MKWLYTVLIGVLTIGFIYFLSGDEAPSLNPFPQELSDEPDALIEGFKVTQFDTKGTKLYEIAANHASYYERDGHTSIDGLRMKVFTPDENVWHLSAQAGNYEERQADPFLVLDGNVQLRSVGKSQSSIAFETDSLKIYPRRRFVESLSTVTVESGTSKIHAEKFEADLATRMVHFTSRADSQVELLLRTDS